MCSKICQVSGSGEERCCVTHPARESHKHGDRKTPPSASHRCGRGQPGGCVLHRSGAPCSSVAVRPAGAGESATRAAFFAQLAGEDIRCPDLLLLDYSLPGSDTRELLQWIKAVPVCRRLRIIVTAASDDPAIQQDARTCGADAFFWKPVSFQQFLALVLRFKNSVMVFGLGLWLQ